MEKVNVYDFDKTILPYDSTAAFFKFCVRRHGRVLAAAAPCLPKLLSYRSGPMGKTKFKESFYNFLTAVPDIDAAVEEFWNENFKNINDWYIYRKKADDIIISASPEFLLKLPAEKLGVRLIASRVDKRSGRTIGLNNVGAEKVVRLREEYPNIVINEFYSDSHHAHPFAALGVGAFSGEGQKRSPWDFSYLKKKNGGDLRRRLSRAAVRPYYNLHVSGRWVVSPPLRCFQHPTLGVGRPASHGGI